MFKDEIPHTTDEQDCLIADMDGRLFESTYRAIRRLLEAHSYAVDTGRSLWEFAVTIAELRRDGVTENELRWLACRGYIEHGVEVSAAGNERAFDRHVSLRLSKRSAFVITPAGIAFSREFPSGVAANEAHDESDLRPIEAAPDDVKQPAVGNGHHRPSGDASPKWDRDRRELRVGAQVVKVFKLPSPMQETILVAFEEEHWPPRIDDPLPSHPELLPKRRLHDTIKSLNRNQKHPLIRFMGDGTGEGIRWEFNSSARSSQVPDRLLP
jgi:hypothetical protein